MSSSEVAFSASFSSCSVVTSVKIVSSSLLLVESKSLRLVGSPFSRSLFPLASSHCFFNLAVNSLVTWSICFLDPSSRRCMFCCIFSNIVSVIISKSYTNDI